MRTARDGERPVSYIYEIRNTKDRMPSVRYEIHFTNNKQ
jgi:hypothetical protein